jgi:hypothetical protein
MGTALGTRGEQQAAMLVIRTWRDPENEDIRAEFMNDVLLFDSFVRAAASGRAKVFSRGSDRLQKKLDPIVAQMSEIDY